MLALDRDATDTALDLANQYGLLAPGLTVLTLMQDLKYEPLSNIRKLINETAF